MSDQRYSLEKLACLSHLDRRTVSKRLATVPREKGGYLLAEALPFLVQTPENAEAEARILAARERERAANADIAEMQRGRLAETLIPKAEAMAEWKDSVARARMALLNFPGLEHEQRMAISEAIIKAATEKAD